MQFKFKPGIEIGSLSAEDDQFLIQTFIEKSEMESIRDVNGTKCILLGRTGSGKSAILKHLEETETYVKRINPENLSLQFLSNSTILNYFIDLNINLDLFYKLLWKHIFIVEALKMYFGVDGVSTKSKFIEFLQRLTNSKEYNLGISYLKNYESDFWNKCETRIKEMENKIAESFSRELKIPFTDLSLFLKENATKECIEKFDVKHKAETVIKESQLKEINNVFEAMQNELFKRNQKKLYIIIDDLDKDWIDPKIVNSLIKGLILTMYEFRGLNGLKIIIALRSNIIELAFYDDNNRGIQREKYFNMIANLKWTREELKDLVNRRLSLLMKNQYSNLTPKIEDIFPEAKKNKKSGFEEILDKSFLRPRDIIDFVNKCIENAKGSTRINREAIRLAEYEYSKNRFKALIDEWKENYGNVTSIVSILKGKAEPILFDNFKENDFLDFYIGCEENKFSPFILKWYKKFKETQDFNYLIKNIFLLLYKIGFVGVKIDSQSTTVYSYNSNIEFVLQDFNQFTKFYIHPAFSSYLRTKVAYA